jgi:hypothetical protein
MNLRAADGSHPFVSHRRRPALSPMPLQQWRPAYQRDAVCRGSASLGAKEGKPRRRQSRLRRRADKPICRRAEGGRFRPSCPTPHPYPRAAHRRAVRPALWDGRKLIPDSFGQRVIGNTRMRQLARRHTGSCCSAPGTRANHSWRTIRVGRASARRRRGGARTGFLRHSARTERCGDISAQHRGTFSSAVGFGGPRRDLGRPGGRTVSVYSVLPTGRI